MIVFEDDERCSWCISSTKPFTNNAPGIWRECNERYGVCGWVEGKIQCTRCYWTGNNQCSMLLKAKQRKDRLAVEAKVRKGKKPVKQELALPLKQGSVAKKAGLGKTAGLLFGQTNSKFGVGKMTTRSSGPADAESSKAAGKAKKVTKKAPEVDDEDSEEEDEEDEDVIEALKSYAQALTDNGTAYYKNTPKSASKKLDLPTAKAYLNMADMFVDGTVEFAEKIAACVERLEQEAEQDPDEEGETDESGSGQGEDEGVVNPFGPASASKSRASKRK